MGGQKKGEEIQSDIYWQNLYLVSYPEFFSCEIEKVTVKCNFIWVVL